MAELIIKDIEKTYHAGEGKVLDGISLTVHDGEMAFLLGPSGCGKSTLLRILAGLIQPDSGSILLDGKDIAHLPPEKRNMPMVFQNYALWPHLDVYENIAFGLKMLNLNKKAIESRVDEMLETVQMEKFKHRKIPSLSGGQQQRIALARALALNPAVLLLDEPLSNLDAKLRDTMRFEIRRICKERKLTAVYVTHDRKEALSMADSIAVFERGKLSQTGSPREVYLHPANQFCASFLGDVNFLDAVCTGENLFRTCGGIVLKTSASTVPAQTECRLAFRPEAVIENGGINCIPVTLLKSTFLGESSFLTLQTEDGTVFHMNEYSGQERQEGDRFIVSVPPERITVLEN